ncbi:MAG: hypothetical protein IRY85_09510 [Micromonosporaceae bacterium]|nr:hypothetical protein [Micromonosporaceae bacterium]
MRHWVGIVSEEQFTTERLYARESVVVDAGTGTAGAAPAPTGPDGRPELGDPELGAPELGDGVALVAAGERPVLFGHGIVRERDDSGRVVVEYRARVFDDPPPVPADAMPSPVTPGLHAVPSAQFTRLSTLVAAAAEANAGRSVWFVSVAVPIEAATPAEAVREFWTYVDKLGPRELPAYVWPLGDELAMQAFVLGAVTNLDPEEDD